MTSSQFLAKKQNVVMKFVLWAFAFYIAWMLVPKGFAKINMENGPAWFLETFGYVAPLFWSVAVIELVFPFGLFFQRISSYFAFAIFVVMAFASYHSGWGMTELSLAFLSLLIAWYTRPMFLRKKTPVTKISI